MPRVRSAAAEIVIGAQKQAFVAEVVRTEAEAKHDWLLYNITFDCTRFTCMTSNDVLGEHEVYTN